MFEAPQEVFSERRVHLLKSQITHLERQVGKIYTAHPVQFMLFSQFKIEIFMSTGTIFNWFSQYNFKLNFFSTANTILVSMYTTQ